MDTFLGLELSGTRLFIGEVDDQGNIYHQKRYEGSLFNQKVALGFMEESLTDFIRSFNLIGHMPRAIGVGVMGRVNADEGIWYQIDPDRTQPIYVGKLLSERFGVPCYIDNDVKSATRAEMMWGFGRQTDNFIYLKVDTGIAAGIVVNGHIVRGSHCNAGEVGHVRTGVHVGVKCPCGRVDCVEAIASGLGIDRCARLLAPQHYTRLHIPTDNGLRVSMADVRRLYEEDDPLCRVIINNAAEALASLIMNLVRVVDPDTVVLGGSIVADGVMLELVRPYLHPVTMRFVTNGVTITKLNPVFIGMLGGAATAIQLCGHQ